VAGCCECGDEPSGSCATELVSFRCIPLLSSSSAVQLFKSPDLPFWFHNNNFNGVRSASRPTPNLEDQGIPFSPGHHLWLSDKGDPASSYPTATLAPSIIWPRKPCHYVKVGVPSVGIPLLRNLIKIHRMLPEMKHVDRGSVHNLPFMLPLCEIAQKLWVCTFVSGNRFGPIRPSLYFILSLIYLMWI
jgi:hypothetical protein